MGCRSYQKAIEACDALSMECAASGAAASSSDTGGASGAQGGASGAQYGLDDLVCFLCLSQHAEAVPCHVMPAAAQPISVEEDLGMDLPTAEPLARNSKPCRKRMRKKVSSGTAISIAGMMLLPWLDIRSAARLDGCCQASRFFALREVGWARTSIADSVADHLSWQSTAVRALLECGVSKSQVLRALAAAWDWLTKTPPHLLMDKAVYLSLVFARLGVKSEIPEKHVHIALGHLGSKGDKNMLRAVESLVVSAACAHRASGGYSVVTVADPSRLRGPRMCRSLSSLTPDAEVDAAELDKVE